MTQCLLLFGSVGEWAYIHALSMVSMGLSLAKPSINRFVVGSFGLLFISTQTACWITPSFLLKPERVCIWYFEVICWGLFFYNALVASSVIFTALWSQSPPWCSQGAGKGLNLIFWATLFITEQALGSLGIHFCLPFLSCAHVCFRGVFLIEQIRFATFCLVCWGKSMTYSPENPFGWNIT